MENSNKKTLRATKKNLIELDGQEKSQKKDKKHNANVDIETPKVKKFKKNNIVDTESMETGNTIEIIDEEVVSKKITKSKKKLLEGDEENKSKDIIQVNEIVTEKEKKAKKRKASEINTIEVHEEVIATMKSKPTESTDNNKVDIEMNCERNDIIKAVVTPMFNALIVNLPSEVSKEELINFISNRGICIDGLQLNNNKYAIIETDNSETVDQISTLITNKPMVDNSSMKVSKLFGNALKLSHFTAKQPQPNQKVVIVKNVDCKTHVDKVLKAVPFTDDIVKHSSVLVRNKGIETQMVTIEFKTAEHTDDVITILSDTTIDGHQLSAEYKYNLVDAIVDDMDTKSDALIIRNLPLSTTKESLIELTKKFDVSPKYIELLPKSGKNCCYIKFNSAEKACDAFAVLKEEVIDGLKLEVKMVAEQKDSNIELAKTKLRITNLPFTVKKEDMEKEFDMAESIKFPMTELGKSKGLCYLSFKTKEMAALVMDNIQERIIGGRKVKCEYVPMSVAFEETDHREEKSRKVKSKPKEKQVGAALTLFNLPAGVTQKDITTHFANVTLFNIVTKGESFKGIAEVHFKDVAAANAAMAVPEFSLKGRVIRKELKGGNWRNGAPSKKAPKPVRSKKPQAQSDSDETADSGDE